MHLLGMTPPTVQQQMESWVCPSLGADVHRGDSQYISDLYSNELGIHQNTPMGCANLQCCDLSSYRLDIHAEIASVGTPCTFVLSRQCARGSGAKLRMTPPYCSQMTVALSDTSPNQVFGVATPPYLYRATPIRAWRLYMRKEHFNNVSYLDFLVCAT